MPETANADTGMAHPQTLSELLARGKAGTVALDGTGATGLTYGELRATVGKAGEALAGRGIAPGARIATVLANGPAAAAAFLVAASSWTACPLNPAYTADEFRFALTDLRARAVLVPAAGTAPAAAAAAAAADCGVQLVPVHEDAGTAGRIHIDGPAGVLPRPGPGDEALALHTSGTTARPKLVPLRHRNLCTSARNISGTLGLKPDDRCLSAMPLFHVHGLVAALLASIYASGSVWCAPGFNALKFYS